MQKGGPISSTYTAQLLPVHNPQEDITPPNVIFQPAYLCIVYGNAFAQTAGHTVALYYQS